MPLSAARTASLQSGRNRRDRRIFVVTRAAFARAHANNLGQRRRKGSARALPRVFGSDRAPRTPDINAGEQEEPDNVDEVPVPGGELEAEMLARRELAEIGTDEADDQENRANDHVEAVEARRHEEGRAVDRAFEAEGGVAVLVGLHGGEADAEQDRQDQSLLQALAIPMQKRVVRPSHRRAGGQQDQRVQKRQMPGIEDFDALWRPMPAGKFYARILNALAGEQARIKKGPEPRDEEHHLRGDEQDHAIAVADLDDARVVAGLGLVNDIGPPRGHNVKHDEQADDQDDAACLEPADGEALHPHDAANRHQESADRADDRPRTRIDEMVVVVRLRVGVRHDGPLRPFLSTALAGCVRGHCFDQAPDHVPGCVRLSADFADEFFADELLAGELLAGEFFAAKNVYESVTAPTCLIVSSCSSAGSRKNTTGHSAVSYACSVGSEKQKQASLSK